MDNFTEDNEVTEKMNDHLVRTFHSMTIESNFRDALTLIRASAIPYEIPPPSVVNDIVFTMLMKNCEENVINDAREYLEDYLLILPTIKRRSFQYDYRAVLHNTDGEFQDIWCAFSHLVESSFIHHNISNENERSCTAEVVKYPNCDILIHFYVNMLTKFISLENGLFEEDSEKRFSIVLEWINKIYKSTYQVIDILEDFHMLLNNKLKYEMSLDSSKKMHSLTYLILDECPDIFSNVQNMKMFIAQSYLPHLEAKICQYKLYELVYKKKLKKKDHFPLTLKTIICNYFFNAGIVPEKETKVEPLESPILKIKLVHRPGQNHQGWVCRNETLANSAIGPPIGSHKRTTTKTQLKKLFLKKKAEGNSRLHNLCRENKFGDVCEMLLFQSNDSNVEVNARNSIGRTPFHEACLAKSYYCAKSLLEDVKEECEKVDLKAGDNDGLTPLHCAAYMDSVEIARLILKYGGSDLVTLKDQFGEKAVKYATSNSMKTLLESYEPKVQESTSDVLSLDFDHLIVPTLKDKEEYSIFLFGLQHILSHYLQNSNLYNYKKDNVEKLSHEQHKCPHYLSLTSAAVCDEDISVFGSLPQILDHFCTSITSYTNEIGVDVHLSLMRLKTLRVMLSNKV